MTYKSVRPGLQNVSCLNGRIFQVFATINMQKEIPFITSSKEVGTVKSASKKYPGRLIGWLVMIFLIVVIVPVGAVMFVISGLWSALDRILLKFNR